MDPASVPGKGEQFPGMGPEFSARKTAIVRQLHTAHLHAMEESVRNILAIRTGRVDNTAAHLAP